MTIAYLDPDGTTYQAGVCNINPREIARRRRIGILGVTLSVMLAVVLVAVGAPTIARALVLFPLWAGIISLEQARRRFCAGFAYAGIRSGSGADRTVAVTDPHDLARDRAAARWMVIYCGAIAAAITVIFVLVPV